MIFKHILHFISVYFSSVYFYTEIQLKVSVKSSNIIYKRLPSSSKKLAYINPPNAGVLAADYGTHLYYFFSATTNEPIYAAFVIVKHNFLQQLTNKHCRWNRADRRWFGSPRATSKLGNHPQASNGGSYHKRAAEKALVWPCLKSTVTQALFINMERAIQIYISKSQYLTQTEITFNNRCFVVV